MYERSAIVLERYFENLLGYTNECNLRDNVANYCELVMKLEKFQANYQKEVVATQEFNASIKKIKSIKAAQEKLYKKSAKLEYNRNLLFANIDAKPEDTRRCIEKVEADVEQNNEDMKELKEELLGALAEYNEKKFELSKCKRYKKMAENDYDEIFETARDNYDGITTEDINTAKKFAKFDNNGDIIEILQRNGKNEKIPFNEDVMRDATKFGVEVAKKEVASYLVIYDKMTKLLSDINNGTTKIELHKKYLRNEKAKVDFILATKEYIVQFLDYERMTDIHGRKSHNRLMSEACENFNTDVIQINNLYELLLKEISNKATKKAYRELYNKSYLTEIKQKEERFKKEKNRVNLNTATLINSNYWRIEGIRNIYSVFYKNVSEVFGRDVAEFDIPKGFESYDTNETEEQEDFYDDTIIEDTVRIPFDIGEDEEDDEDYNDDYGMDKTIENDEEDSISGMTSTYEEILDNVVEEIKEGTDANEIDIFGDRYRDIDSSEVIQKAEEKMFEEKIDNNIENSNAEDINFIEDEFEDGLLKDNMELFENEERNEEPSIFDTSDDEVLEDTLFSDVKKIKNKRNSNEIENFDITKEEKKTKSVLKKLRKINKAKSTNIESDIW